MRRFFTVDRHIPPLLLPVVGALIAIAIARGPAPAHAQDVLTARSGEPQRTKTYVIPASEGYGVADCFRQGGQCGEIVASSWCESRGHGKPAAWGAAEDVTASVSASSKSPPRGALVITCNE